MSKDADANAGANANANAEHVASADKYLKVCVLSSEKSTRSAQLKRVCRKLLALGLSKDESLESLSRRFADELSVNDLQEAIRNIEEERKRQDIQEDAARLPSASCAPEERDLFGSLIVAKSATIAPTALVREHTNARARARVLEDARTRIDDPDAGTEIIESRPVRSFFKGTEEFDIEAQRIASELVILYREGFIKADDHDLAAIAGLIHLLEGTVTVTHDTEKTGSF